MDGKGRELVTIIALSYNHATYIPEALQSLFNQTYLNIELIIIDDASSDVSCQVIESCIKDRAVLFLRNEKNIGNCSSFNRAYQYAKGAYIIDFALDDIMYPTRIEKQVALFQNSIDKVGVIFSNVDVISDMGSMLHTHYPKYHHRTNKSKIPVGNVFEALLSQYYVNPVGMMSRREVFERLNGYDESLAYEDFDFWIRSARLFEYAYIPEVLSAKRIVSTSLSTHFYRTNRAAMFESTLQVCKKAWWLCISKSEEQALVARCRYEARQAYIYNYPIVVVGYLEMMKTIDRCYHFYNPIIRMLLLLKKRSST